MNLQTEIPADLLKTLQEETEFRKYLRILKEVSKYAAVAVVSSDTPFGPGLTAGDHILIQKIGFEADFYDKYRYSYAGLIYNGEVLFEKIDANLINETVLVNEIPITLRSCNTESMNRGAGVTIDGKFHRSIFRGLTFYVFSLTEKKAVSVIGFDTYSEKTPAYKLFPPKMLLRNYAEAHSDVTVISVKYPRMESIPTSEYTENEKFIEKNAINLEKALSMGILNEYFSTFDMRKIVLTPPPSYKNVFGVRNFVNYETELVNCRGGIRITPGMPTEYKRAIYLVGGCAMFGVGASDNGTTAAFLQKLLNEKCPEQGFAVFNYGYYMFENTVDDEGTFLSKEYEEVCDIINFLPIRPGDIIITNEGKDELSENIDCSKITRPYKYGDIFFDNIHLTEAGYHEIADKIFEGLQSRDFYKEKPVKKPPLAKTPRRDKLNLKPDEAAQLKTYTDMLDNVAELLKIESTDNIGAIVMNCNPFTNGHRYLIETAAAKVKYLFVFAVQENRSEFPFKERYELMQAATEDIENVYVLPSGNFIISSFTFSEYFNKKSLNTMAVNPSNDIRLFGGQIAPHLFIKTRFAGEEPLDPVTRQYNRQMEAILPQYGIAFEEIKRKETDGNVISASRVRELLKIRDFEAIARLVPDVTLEYLKRKYK